jgi:hypothetical protein
MVTIISPTELSLEVGHMAQNYSIEMNALARFLHIANKRTYANKDVPQVQSSRLKSQDYEFEQDQLTYHDTFFGDRDFIGEEIVYKQEKPVWGANYFGFILADEIGEAEVYDFLRKALMQDYDDVIPVRGPGQYSDGDWRYEFSVKGDLANFSGQEEISLRGRPIYRLFLHGGLIR